MTVHVTIEMDEAVKAKLDAIAAYRGVGVDDLIVQKVVDLAAENDAFLAAVDRGLESLDSGQGVSHEEVVADVMRRRAARTGAA